MDQVIKNRKVIVLGATGYVGGRLVPKLLSEGYHVRATSRSKDKLSGRVWAKHPLVELCDVDLQHIDSLRQALNGIDIAYYLVHSMNPDSKDFERLDRIAAENMVRAGRECGVGRIIYLGGLGDDSDQLSRHLKSRHEVSEILRSGATPVTVLRAAMIIGSGSASFEILRYLVERLPVMITPRWVQTPCQPIAIRNVIEYLYGCLEKDETMGHSFDIGGPQVVSYLELMRIYAEEAGLRKRWVISVPVLTPRLSSLWIHLVTPVPGYIARPLAEGLRNPVICKDQRILKIIPQDLLDCRTAISKALYLVKHNDIKTHWADAGKIPQYAVAQEGDPSWAGGSVFYDKRQMRVRASKEKIWKVIAAIGGETGWYHGTWLWVLRGLIDRLMGGVGSGRGRRNTLEISTGDVLDFWRVAEVERNVHLMLVAEMKLPGVGTLDISIKEISTDLCELQQLVTFRPRGLTGMAYWYCLLPLHNYIFNGMLKKVARLSENV